jgi:hypothetical protein
MGMQAMPVLWAVDHSTRLVVISLNGVIRLKDMEDCLEGIMTAAALSYRKLVDMMAGSPELSRDDILALAERVREHAGRSAMGAVAIVAVSDESELQARLFGSSTVAERPLRIFREVGAARDWLDAQPPPALHHLATGLGPSDVSNPQEMAGP